MSTDVCRWYTAETPTGGTKDLPDAILVNFSKVPEKTHDVIRQLQVFMSDKFISYNGH